MSLNKNIIGRLYERGERDELGVVTFTIFTKSFWYEFQIMEGTFVRPFLAVTVGRGNKSSAEIMTAPFLTYRHVIKVIRILKNEIRD